jgi:predicted nucleic acid-binding protein
MTVYLVDTNIIAYLADVGSPYHENIRAHFQALTDQDSVYLSILTLYELYYSLAKAQESAVSQAIIRTKEQICATLPCLPLSESGARIFGELKIRYQKHSGYCRVAGLALKTHIFIAPGVMNVGFRASA